MKQNYKKQLDQLMLKNEQENIVPTLLLHSCCAPCSSHVLEYLSGYFKIDLLYYNPNITIESEYEYRLAEQKRLLSQMHCKYPVTFRQGTYDPKAFLSLCKGLEQEEEGGRRCALCFNLRLGYTAKLAAENKYDYFTTTLTISPMKNAEQLNSIGMELSKQNNTAYLCSDFKKGNGYQRSIELSKQYNLYRQNYCGCIFSKQQSELRQKAL